MAVLLPLPLRYATITERTDGWTDRRFLIPLFARDVCKAEMNRP